MNWRWEQIKAYWRSGQKWNAIKLLNDSLPNLTYPGGPTKMDDLFAKYGYWKFTGELSGITFWRELWHFTGGFFITLPFIAWPTIAMCVSFAICIWKFFYEFIGDAKGKPDLKNFVDWMFWILGTAAVSIPSFLLFGASHYR